MKTTLTLTLILFAACALVAGCNGNDKPDEGVAPDETTYVYPDPAPEHERAYKDKGWALYVQYFSKGMRSEGVHGALYRDGVEVVGKEKGETLDTPLGKMTWMGARGENPNLWNPSGWHAENTDWMRHSWEVMP